MDARIVRKDAPAGETIERAHTILDSLGFPRERAIVRRWSAGPDCHSCHLRFANYPMIFANGKGVTPELADASALAEFLERLQCRADAVFTRAGNIHRLAPFAPAAARTLGEVAGVATALVARDLGGLTDDTPGGLASIPFVDVFGRRVVDLPFEIFTMMTGSSGMCAGNTLEEALAHGICEVFERHVIHCLDSGLVAGLPTMNRRTLPLRSRLVWRQIDALESTGIRVIVKDASLGGAFPVVALVLADRASGTCHVSFGSDPCFDAAVSRCLTEAFQGADRLFRRPPPADPAARPIDTYNNLEVLLDRMTDEVGVDCSAAAFGETTTNDEAMRFAVDRVRRAGRSLYVRDFSMFGFPACYVYVEELSALRSLCAADFRHLRPHLETVRATLFRLKRASPAEIALCSRVLFDEMVACDPALETRFVAGVLSAPVAACLGLRPLLALMLLETGEVEKARTIVEWPPVTAQSVEEPASAKSVKAWLGPYVEARGGQAESGTLAANHARAFGPEEAAAAEAAERAPLPVPRCQSAFSCPSCPCRKYCRLDEWYRLARRLRDRAEAPSQDALANRLRAIACEGRSRSSCR